MTEENLPKMDLREWNLLRIVMQIEKKAVNIAQTEDILRLLDKFPEANMKELIKMELWKRYLELCNLAEPLLKLYGKDIDVPKLEHENVTIFEILTYTRKLIKAVYELLYELDMFPKKKNMPTEDKLSYYLDVEL